MPDVQTPGAASSPAPVTAPAPAPPTPAPAPDYDVGSMSVPTDPQAYAEWRQTGKLPDKPPSKDDSAPSKPSVDEQSENDAPVSETGSKRQDRRDNAETRKGELNREIRELLAKRDQLKAEVEGTGKKDVKAEPSPAPEPEAKRPVKPKEDDFTDWEQFEAAKDKYYEDLADWKAGKRFDEHIQQQQQRAASQDMQKRLDEAKSRYGEEAEPRIVQTAQTVFNDQQLPPAIKAAVGRSEVLVDALFVLGSDEKQFTQFVDLAKKDPLEALRQWFVIEGLVKEELGKSRPNGKAESTPARGPDGRFLPPEKPVRGKDAPAPPTELNGNSSPAGDERGRAADRGDFRSFKADADRRDLARLRGQ